MCLIKGNIKSLRRYSHLTSNQFFQNLYREQFLLGCRELESKGAECFLSVYWSGGWECAASLSHMRKQSQQIHRKHANTVTAVHLPVRTTMLPRVAM